MTLDDAKTRFLANRTIADPVARAADLDSLRTDISTEWGAERVESIFMAVVQKLGLESGC